MRHGIVITILIGALAAVGACDAEQQPTPTAPTPIPTMPTGTSQSDPDPTSLAVTGPDSLMVGATVQYEAMITYSDGAERPGEDVEWVSGNTTVATVDAAGIVTGRQAGSFDLRAMAMGVSGSKTGIRVEAPETTSLSVEGPGSLQVGQTVTYEAVVTLSDGSTTTATDVQWTSSNTTVATVDAGGTVTGRQAGSFDLRAMAMGVSGRKAGIRVDAAPQTGTWRGLTIAPENRCSPYDSDNYSYPQSVEVDIVRNLGGIYSPYTCESFDSTGETDIEHIVARSEAHDSGLCSADTGTRRQFARDLLNLTLAAPSLNRSQKSDMDAAEWMSEQNRCWFAQTIVDVRLQYGLTIDRAEADALDRMLAGCTSTAISCNITPPRPTDHPPVQAYQNCTAMRAAGWNRGVNRNGGTYRDSWDDAERRTYSLNTSSDRDNDGHACE